METEENTENKDNKFKREVVIPGEVIASGKDYLPGEGTRREENDIIAGKFGLVDMSGRVIRIIPLSGAYMPRFGNTVIGRVTDVTFNGWVIDIKAPYNSFLSLAECSRYIRGDLTEFYDIEDMMVCKVIGVKSRGVDLTIKGHGLGKLEQGMIMFINSNKVPRVIGKEGSMIKLIKDATGCDIIVGQNGVIWIQGDSFDNELKAKEAILFVVKRSFVEGLTDKVEEYLKNQNQKNPLV